MANTLDNISASLLAFCKSFGEAMLAQENIPLEVVDFEAVQEELELPMRDVVGPSHLMLEVDEHELTITCLIGCSTYVDGNNFRLRKLSGYLFEELKPTKCIPLLDADTGVVLSSMVVANGTRMMPVTGGDRPARFFAVTLKSLSALTL